MKYLHLFAIPLSALLTLSTLLTSFPAHSGGMVVHMFQSEKAVAQLEDPVLKQLLTDNSSALNSGTQYPDAGYSPSFYGQEKHVWEWPHINGWSGGGADAPPQNRKCISLGS